MTEPRWQGVFPAVTTQFHPDGGLDLGGTVRHVEALLEAGVHGLVMLGTLGEGTSLEPEEKREVVAATVETADGRVPVLAGIAETTTAAAVRAAERAGEAGAQGLMLLPALAYKADRSEAVEHYRTVARHTDLPIMIYNNPVSYGVDLGVEGIAELASQERFVAVKESSDDVRRVTDLINLLGDRYAVFCGVDDLALESLLMGAEGWVAGLVDAFPRETVAIWEHARAGRWEEARRIYRWFAPLLHLDTHPKLVQYIKVAMAEVGLGTEHVRAPRLRLEGSERRQVLAIVAQAMEDRPALRSGDRPEPLSDRAR